MNHNQLSSLSIAGFKSIKSCDIEMKNLNVLIGANGSGKSNFIGFFKFIHELLDENLQSYTSKSGGPDSILHFGRKHTEHLEARFMFGNNGYKFSLEATQDNRLMFSNENLWWNMRGDWHIGSGHFETYVHNHQGRTRIYDYTIPTIKNWRIYHFHDTSSTAVMKQRGMINDNIYLRPDARNLAAFLFLLKERYPKNLKRIEQTIRLVAPFFGEFLLRPNPLNSEQIELEWFEKDYDIPFKAHQLSDGTLRFICLSTVLLQPQEYQPETILIDEPELGLHPYAITILASLMKSVSKEKQLIISTQSVDLVSEFSFEDLIIVDRINHESKFRRVNETEEMQHWLEEYTLGEIWEKNLLGGRPSR